MSYETEKHKLEKLYNENIVVDTSILNAQRIQNNKTTQVKLAASNSLKFSKIFTYSSEWMPVVVREYTDFYNTKVSGILFKIEKRIPESWIPFSKLNLVFRSEQDVFKDSFNRLLYNTSINDTSSMTLKDVTWTVAFSQTGETLASEYFTHRDFDMKLLFSLINPLSISSA